MEQIPRKFVLLLAAFLSLATNRSGIAQDTLNVTSIDSIHLRNGCRLAQQILVTGRPANKRNDALRWIPRCGAIAGETVGAILARFRNSPVPPQDLEELIAALWGLRDADVLSKSMAVSEDNSATVPVRIEAMRLVLGQVEPSVFVPYRMVASDSGEVAMWDAIDTPERTGTPLPPGYLINVGSRMEALAGDDDAPETVRRFAAQIAFLARRGGTTQP